MLPLISNLGQDHSNGGLLEDRPQRVMLDSMYQYPGLRIVAARDRGAGQKRAHRIQKYLTVKRPDRVPSKRSLCPTVFVARQGSSLTFKKSIVGVSMSR